MELLLAASAAGHTVLPYDIVTRLCPADAVGDAIDAGEVTELPWRGARAVALTDLAEDEELLAEGLAALAAENRLAVVTGSQPQARRRKLDAALPPGMPCVVLDDAHLTTVEDAAAAVEDLPEDAVLAFSLDHALPLGPGPGAVALDLAASGVCPVLRADESHGPRLLDRARDEVAAGRWPSGEGAGEDRSWVTVPVASPDEAVRRVHQLLTTSIPRAFGVPAAEVGVLLAEGALEPAQVVDGLDGAPPQVVPLAGAPAQAWRAVVIVLPGSAPASLTRAVLYAGMRAGTEHVSVVHGMATAALAQVVAGTTDRPRRTRLVELLHWATGAGPAPV